MMNGGTQVERHMSLWSAWNFDKQQQRLDELSESGLHMVKPGLWRATYVRDEHARYVYRLDFQSSLCKRKDIKEYLGLYEDAGWEYIGRCSSWYYFRKPWSPGILTELYTDRESIRQHYKRIQQLFIVLFMVEFVMLFTNMNTFFHGSSSDRVITAVVMGMLVCVIIVLGYGWFVMSQKLKNKG